MIRYSPPTYSRSLGPKVAGHRRVQSLTKELSHTTLFPAEDPVPTGPIRLRRKKQLRSLVITAGHLPSASLPNSPNPLNRTPKNRLQRIDTMLMSLHEATHIKAMSKEIAITKSVFSQDLQSLKKSLITKEYHGFSKTRKKLLEEEVVLSKAKIRMMLFDLRVKLKQARVNL